MATATSPAAQSPQSSSRLYLFYSGANRQKAIRLIETLRDHDIATEPTSVENRGLWQKALANLRTGLPTASTRYFALLASRALLETDATFRAAVDLCDQVRGLTSIPAERRILLCYDDSNRQPRIGNLRAALRHNFQELAVTDPNFADTPESTRRLLELFPTSDTTIARAPIGGPFYVVKGVFDPQQPASEVFTELEKQLKQGLIDQRYLYWDVRAAIRWLDITEATEYYTNNRSLNLLIEHGKQIVDDFVAQASAITQSSRFDVSLINLGVGTGYKDSTLLTHLSRHPSVRSIQYFAIDDSFPMIQITIPTILGRLWKLDQTQREKLSLHYLVTAFERLNEGLTDYIDSTETEENQRRGTGDASTKRIRLVCFLGGSVGNFREEGILGLVRDSLLRDSGDMLLLGTENIANRDKTVLEANYSDTPMKDFLFGPIRDAKPELFPRTPYSSFLYDTVPSDQALGKYSDVPGSKTVVGYVNLANTAVGLPKVQLFYSTKYIREKLRMFLDSQGFDRRFEYNSDEADPIITKYLLTKRAGGKA